MSFHKKVRFANDSINISFFKEPFSSSEILVFIPGGPGLSSSYLKPFCSRLSERLTIDIALLDLPNHNLSTSISNLNFTQAGQLISSALNELSKKYYKVSVFAHSLGGCLMFVPSSQKSELEALFMCNVPYEYSHSTMYLQKKTALSISQHDLQSEKDFINYFKLVTPLYFHDLRKFNHNDFWSEGCFIIEGQKVMTKAISVSENIRSLPNCKILCFIEGVHDIVLPESNSKKFKKYYPNSIFQSIKDAGHFPFIENSYDVISTVTNVLTMTKSTDIV